MIFIIKFYKHLKLIIFQFQGINTIINIAVFYIIINIILSFVNEKMED